MGKAKLRKGKDVLAHKKTNVMGTGAEAWNCHTKKKVYIVCERYNLTGKVQEFKNKKEALKVFKDLRKR